MNLNLFCELNSRDSRFNLTTPWLRDGWRYATDGVICVRIPAPAEPDMPEDQSRRPSGIEKLFNEFPECRPVWPKWQYELIPCRKCDATGRVLVDCPKCTGKDCAACVGSGKVPSKVICPYCDGEEIIRAPLGESHLDSTKKDIVLAGRRYDVWYLALIERNVRRRKWAVKQDGTMAFTGTAGVQGLLANLED